MDNVGDEHIQTSRKSSQLGLVTQVDNGPQPQRDDVGGIGEPGSVGTEEATSNGVGTVRGLIIADVAQVVGGADRKSAKWGGCGHIPHSSR